MEKFAKKICENKNLILIITGILFLLSIVGIKNNIVAIIKPNKVPIIKPIIVSITDILIWENKIFCWV